nr:MAG TPA: hypothetical protein [Bacteriophage sp.]
MPQLNGCLATKRKRHTKREILKLFILIINYHQ